MPKLASQGLFLTTLVALSLSLGLAVQAGRTLREQPRLHPVSAPQPPQTNRWVATREVCAAPRAVPVSLGATRTALTSSFTCD